MQNIWMSADALRRWTAWTVAIFTMALLAGCSSKSEKNLQDTDTHNAPKPDSTVGPANDSGGDCSIPGPGCACPTDGEYLKCGKVIAESGGLIQCGQGLSLCAGGVWGECILNNNEHYVAVSRAPLTSDHDIRLGTLGLGGPSPCTKNPCDPYCVDFPDDPSGLVDAGTNIKPVDGGMSDVPDAGTLPCTKRTCATYSATCGIIGDGCGGTINCGTCATGQSCGAGGVPFQCGTPIPPCAPLTQCPAGKNCGTLANGCGGTINCGTCNGQTSPATGTQICGGGGQANVCATPPSSCKAKTCADYGFNCGTTTDGCGGTLNCGTCNGQTSPATGTQICGGAGQPNRCGTPPSSCTPKKCSDYGYTCGTMGDGCGNTITCGSYGGGCPSGQGCGIGGNPNVCGQYNPPCIAKTCATAGNKNCGVIGDGCGGTLNCGTCAAGLVCGGSGVDNVCGNNPSCTNFCTMIPQCSAGGTTSVTGKVYAPNGVDPLPNVIVYVPNGSMSPPYGVTAFPSTVTCDNCLAASGSPLIATTTDVNGAFTLTGMPAGNNIPIIIQVGRWRRLITIPTVTACKANPLASTATRFLKSQSEYTNTTIDNIPKIAISTGAVDGMECALRKMGIADSEFTGSNGTGRVNFYGGNVAPGTYVGSCSTSNANDTPTCLPGQGCYYTPRCWNGRYGSGGGSNNTLWEDRLVGDPAQLAKYDMVLFPCQGYMWWYYYNADQQNFQSNITNYVNKGGRVFATHFSYNWLASGSSGQGANYYSTLSSAIPWSVNQGTPANQTGYINQSFPKGQLMAQWLKNIGASSTLGQIYVETLRKDFNSPVSSPTQSWLSLSSGQQTHVTFNTPIGAAAANQCGRVVYSDIHVEDYGSTQYAFPSECTINPGTMTPQEKMLEFMLFDLASCVTPDNSQPCIPATCSSLGQCGNNLPNGCGTGTLNCSCTAPDTCGGGGIAGVCGHANTCTPLSSSYWSNQGYNCGVFADGCGNTINLGNCTLPQTCGGGGVAGQCGMGACTKLTCSYWTNQGYNCGIFADGCGGTLNCGSCTLPQTCGGNGQANVCGAGTCTPKTCAQQGIGCGMAGDGCGNTINCGTCAAGLTCGGGGVPMQCGAPPVCNPQSCATQGLSCGTASDGCGGTLNCGSCSSPATCGGAGIPGQCGFVEMHDDSMFVRDYNAESCPSGTSPTWNMWSWTTTTPNNSRIEFWVQTATTAAGLSAAPMIPVRFTHAPAALLNQPAVAHAAGVPAGTPDTQIGSASIDGSLAAGGQLRHNRYVRVISKLYASSNKLSGPTLNQWDLQMSCIPSE